MESIQVCRPLFIIRRDKGCSTEVMQYEAVMRREGAGLQTKVQDGGKVRVKVLCSIGVLLLLDYESISTRVCPCA